MIELAFILHWQPQDMDAMDLGELLQWRERAVKLHNQMHAAAPK